MRQRLIALAFLFALVFTLAPATAVETAPVDLGVLPLLGLETPEWMAPSAGIIFAGPSWCTNRNNQWCTYGWDFANQCCYATWISPGAYCPTMCY